ncbi:unannotated protein [freshwater metagenome]|uniref:Unannotated protein n=1 Tax=freshwater metagenome TaxID=449393 RepID=A0A6J6J0C3_9ZZZZ|nr:DUF3046 domain-containing protein [Actinomycetota bacterium]
MRLSQFHELMADEFGKAHAEVIIRDFALLELGDQTGATLLARGEDPKHIWLAICRAQQVPKERWSGLDKKAKKQHAE